MPNNVVHFAIQVDDTDRAKAFYGGIFGWRFEDWGPPGFFRVHTGDEAHPGIEGALYKRHEPLTGAGMRGFRCTIGVDDIGAIRAAVLAHGAKLRFDISTIPTVGTLIEFEDPEGNIVCAMQYETPRY